MDQLQKKFGSVWQKMHVKQNSEITVGWINIKQEILNGKVIETLSQMLFVIWRGFEPHFLLPFSPQNN